MAFKVFKYNFHALMRSFIRSVQNDLSILRFFIRIIHTGKTFDQSFSAFLYNPFTSLSLQTSIGVDI